jgi:hypothetical protein
VAITPLHESEHDHPQLTTLAGQVILHARPPLRLSVLRALEDPFLDELGRSLGQQVARAAQNSVELLEPGSAVEALPDDQQGPLLADDLQGRGDRTVACLIAGALLRRILPS